MIGARKVPGSLESLEQIQASCEDRLRQQYCGDPPTDIFDISKCLEAVPGGASPVRVDV
jgi:hypothetical protein